MAIQSGIKLSNIVANVLIDLGDPNGWRWKTAYVLGFLNEAIRALAKGDVFRRVDIHVPTSLQSRFSFFADMQKIYLVQYNGSKITPTSRANMEKIKGQTWRALNGTPERCLMDKKGITLCPKPSAIGTALIFAGSPDITEEQGGKVAGDGYYGADDGGTIAHFLDGDGEVSNIHAESNLHIVYSYIPNASAANDTVDKRLESALNAYARWQCLYTSQDPSDIAFAESARREWMNYKDELIEESQESNLAADGSGNEVVLSQEF